MIDDLDETLRELLQDELSTLGGEIDIEFDQPKREWSARLARPTINLFLYDIRENAQLRKFGWEEQAQTTIDEAKRKRAPLRLDCTYLLTTWASEPADEHRLMASAMTALFRHGTLPPERLTGRLATQPYALTTRLASHDKLTNPAEVWSALDNEVRPTVSFIVTVSLDPWTTVADPIVQTMRLQAGQSAGESRTEHPSRPTPVSFGGTIQQDNLPLANLTVAIKDSGFVTQTDRRGRYRFRGVRAGKHTLVIWQEAAPPTEHEVEISQAATRVDVALAANSA